MQSGKIAALALFFVTIGASLVALYGSARLLQIGLFRPYFFLRERQYDTLITSGFLHADLSHLIFNMVTFYFFAIPLAEFIGAPKFLLLYFAGLILSNLCTLRKHHKNPDYASLGASGAISAALFAYVMYFPTSKLYVFPIPFAIPAPLFAVAFVGYSYYAARHQRGRINHDAHLCGAISGVAFVLLSDPAIVTRLLA